MDSYKCPIFCVNHSDMKTTQEIIAILRHFKMTEGDRYGISRLGIFGSVARGSRLRIVMWMCF